MPTDPSKRGNYKQSAPQTVKTTGPTHSLNIPLNYGHTITISGQVLSVRDGDWGFKNGATVTIEVEKVVIEDKTTTTSGNGNYSITFDHPGTFRIIASLAGFSSADYNVDETRGTLTKRLLLD